MSALVTLCILAQLGLFGLYMSQQGRWEFRTVVSRRDSNFFIRQIEMYYNDRRVTCGELLNHHLQSRRFVSALAQFLQTDEFTKDKFYYLNFTPFQKNFLHRPCTILLLRPQWGSEADAKTPADFSRYAEYKTQCSSWKSVITFRSKKESQTLLVVPCPLTADASDRYRSIQSFTENAPIYQQRQLYAEIRKQIFSHFDEAPGLQNVPMFVTTHGRDVPWLHVRLETPLPKHYTALKPYFDELP